MHMPFYDTEEYSLRSIAILGCNVCSQITVAHVTLPKAVLSTVKILAVHYGFLSLGRGLVCKMTLSILFYGQSGLVRMEYDQNAD